MLKKETGIDAKLVAGTVGQFDVIVDGKLLFSKQKEGRFPQEEEILRSLPS
jgi:selT/selW/selH-like putative selenoprotein